ncbi:unnamed protein product [Gulo gulo]|uniref:Uncharacterized protein n=1 Tax=Gulo gulo TaxID=48420 RepID=A0A9X9M4J4_GULGU|nr:unnamed protein product [Gulo gulo]
MQIRARDVWGGARPPSFRLLKGPERAEDTWRAPAAARLPPDPSRRFPGPRCSSRPGPTPATRAGPAAPQRPRRPPSPNPGAVSPASRAARPPHPRRPGPALVGAAPAAPAAARPRVRLAADGPCSSPRAGHPVRAVRPGPGVSSRGRPDPLGRERVGNAALLSRGRRREVPQLAETRPRGSAGRKADVQGSRGRAPRRTPGEGTLPASGPRVVSAAATSLPQALSPSPVASPVAPASSPVTTLQLPQGPHSNSITGQGPFLHVSGAQVRGAGGCRWARAHTEACPARLPGRRAVQWPAAVKGQVLLGQTSGATSLTFPVLAGCPGQPAAGSVSPSVNHRHL